jgi:hypothetical protein
MLKLVVFRVIGSSLNARGVRVWRLGVVVVVVWLDRGVHLAVVSFRGGRMS